MMYAMRTSTLRPGTVEEFEARFAQRATLPGEVSSIGGFLAHRARNMFECRCLSQ